MPTVLRQSGPKWIKDGETVTPRAAIHFYEGCGYEGASFGDTIAGKRLYFCGWEGRPVCVGRGSK